MQWVAIKKLDTAFQYLRDAYDRVGTNGTEPAIGGESLKDTAADVQSQVKMAAAAGDLQGLIKMLMRTTKLSYSDYVQATVGPMLHLYYQYCDKFHTRPVDLIDLMDGILYMACQGYKMQLDKEGR